VRLDDDDTEGNPCEVKSHYRVCGLMMMTQRATLVKSESLRGVRLDNNDTEGNPTTKLDMCAACVDSHGGYVRSRSRCGVCGLITMTQRVTRHKG